MQSDTVVVKKRFWFFTVLTVLAYLLMRFITNNLPGKEIIGFEMAKTIDEATSIMNGWDADKISRFLKGIYTDFIFIIGYAGTLFYGCRLMGELSGHYILKKAGNVFSFLAIIAAVCDVIENIGMLFTIKERLLSWVIHLTSDMARIKFSLIFIMLLYIIICLLFWLIDKLATSRKRPIL